MVIIGIVFVMISYKLNKILNRVHNFYKVGEETQKIS